MVNRWVENFKDEWKDGGKNDGNDIDISNWKVVDYQIKEY